MKPCGCGSCCVVRALAIRARARLFALSLGCERHRAVPGGNLYYCLPLSGHATGQA